MHQPVGGTIARARGRRRFRRWWWATILVGLIAGAVVWFTRKDEVIAVTTEKAAARDITQAVSATGKIRPEIEVKISPEVAGEIIALPVVVGQSVKRGDLLVKIKPDNYVARVKQAEASLSAAQADSLQRRAQMLNDELDLHRFLDLYNKKLVSESDYKGADTKSQMARASYESSLHNIDVAASALDQAKDLLQKTVIYAPMDGTISVLSSEVGERVVATGDFAGTEVMRVANLKSMEARVDVNENDVVSVNVGDSVRVQVDAFVGQTFHGVVKRIASTATVKNEGSQQEVTNFEVRIQMDQSGPQLRPGMSASVEIETATVRGTVSVPIQAITVRSRDDGKTQEQMRQDRSQQQDGVTIAGTEAQDRKRLQRVVFLKQGDVAKSNPVQTGIADSNYIQVTRGLKEGDEVIVGPYTAISKTLHDGAKVKLEVVHAK